MKPEQQKNCGNLSEYRCNPSTIFSNHQNHSELQQPIRQVAGADPNPNDGSKSFWSMFKDVFAANKKEEKYVSNSGENVEERRYWSEDVAKGPEEAQEKIRQILCQKGAKKENERHNKDHHTAPPNHPTTKSPSAASSESTSSSCLRIQFPAYNNNNNNATNSNNISAAPLAPSPQPSKSSPQSGQSMSNDDGHHPRPELLNSPKTPADKKRDFIQILKHMRPHGTAATTDKLQVTKPPVVQNPPVQKPPLMPYHQQPQLKLPYQAISPTNEILTTTPMNPLPAHTQSKPQDPKPPLDDDKPKQGVWKAVPGDYVILEDFRDD